MRKYLLMTQYTAATIAIVALFLILFPLAHTDTVAPGKSFIVACIGGVGALITGLIQWAGVPPAEEKQDPEKKGQ